MPSLPQSDFTRINEILGELGLPPLGLALTRHSIALANARLRWLLPGGGEVTLGLSLPAAGHQPRDLCHIARCHKMSQDVTRCHKMSQGIAFRFHSHA